MNIIIHRGTDQIGGNIVEISTDTTKILFDVGLELDPDKNIELPGVEGLFEGKGLMPFSFPIIMVTIWGSHIKLVSKSLYISGKRVLI